MRQRLNDILNYNSNNRKFRPNWEKLFSQLGKKYSLTSAQNLRSKAIFRTLLVVLMMVCNFCGAWAQTNDYSGTYYIASDYQTPNTTTRNYNPTTLTNNFYLCPTENWISYFPTSPNWRTGDDRPFLTTYKINAHNDYDNTKAKWTIEYYATESGTDYYYFKHSSGQYMVLNDAISDVTGNNATMRLRIHLETLTSEQLDVEDTRNLALFSITQDSRFHR